VIVICFVYFAMFVIEMLISVPVMSKVVRLKVNAEKLSVCVCVRS
jgi:hypothetical protein